MYLFNPIPEIIQQMNVQGGSPIKSKIIKIPQGDSWNRMNVPIPNLSKKEIIELYFKNTNIDFVLDNLDNLVK
jgi:hypothetical protein